MNADTYELKKILGFERRYVVPTFQRDYEWTKEDQWALLFEDLEVVASRLEKARQDAASRGDLASTADKTVSPHFLGAIVLDQLPSAAGGLDLRTVIDGQQRLTTIQLLLRGVLDVLIAQGSGRVQQVRRLIQNPSDIISHEHEVHKLWPRRRDREVWRTAMADEDAGPGKHLYLQARRFFRDETRRAVILASGDRSDVFVDALLSLFKLVVIDLEDNDDAQVIFEVLNGRQTPLSATDLVKNLLFLRAELKDEAELEALYEKHWAHFDDAWWKQVIGRGHAARGRRDVLLSSWLTAASGSEINVGHLYGEARRFLDAGPPKIVEVLGELSRFAGAFRVIAEPDGSTPKRMAEAYRRLDQLGVTTALPLLVWLRTLPASQLSPADHNILVTAIDSWVLRRMIVGANTRGYGKRFVDVLRAAKNAAAAGQSVSEAVGAALMQGWSTNAEVESAFVNLAFYDRVSEDRIRLLLGAIDKQLHLDHKLGEHPTFNYETLQIEHILPRSWTTHWPLESLDDAARMLAQQKRESVKNRIGNLTLVTASLNPTMSNGPWSVKRDALRVHSHLQLNAEIVECQAWHETEIENRARRLAEVACRIWPRP